MEAKNPSRRVAPLRVLARRVRRVYHDEVGAGRQALLVAWSAFGATFGITRAITYWSHGGAAPSAGGIVIGGRHIHHYNLGIALLAVVGAIALRGQETDRRHPLTATAYGSGAALIIDELALLIDLQDVYWARDGRRSVDAAIGSSGCSWCGSALSRHRRVLTSGDAGPRQHDRGRSIFP